MHSRDHEEPLAHRRTIDAVRVFVIAIVLLLTVSLGLYGWRGVQPLVVQTVRVERATVQVGYDEDGFVRSDVEAKVAARTAGRIRSIDARDGSSVTRGQTIATLDASEIRAAIDAADADAARARAVLDDTITSVRAATQTADSDLDAARAQLDTAVARRDEVVSGAREAERARARALKAQADTAAWEARRSYQREDRLFKAGYVPQRQLDAAWSALRQAEARQRQAAAEWRLVEEGPRAEDRRAAEAQVAQAHAVMATASARLDKARAGQSQVRAARAALASADARARQSRAALADVELRVPFSGSLVLQDVAVGDVVAPGTLLARVVDPTRVYVEAQIDERDMAGVRLGMTVRVTCDSWTDQTFEGRLVRMQGEAIQKRRGLASAAREEDRIFKARVEVSDPKHLLHPGMTVYAQVVTDTLEDVLVLPREAVQPRGAEWVVWRVENGRAWPRVVTLGAREVRRVQVKSGLEAGDEVVVAGREKLTDGSRVLPMVSAPPAPTP